MEEGEERKEEGVARREEGRGARREEGRRTKEQGVGIEHFFIWHVRANTSLVLPRRPLPLPCLTAVAVRHRRAPLCRRRASLPSPCTVAMRLIAVCVRLRIPQTNHQWPASPRRRSPGLAWGA